MFDPLNMKRCVRWLSALSVTLALCTSSASAWSAPGPLTVLYAFHGTDGSAPYQLVEGADGTLYGATSHGGAYGAGTVFKLKPPAGGAGAWTLSVLASLPVGLPGQLMVDATGAFAMYGSTRDGGQSGPYGGYCDFWGWAYGCGSIFRVAPPAGGRGSWTSTTIYEFTGSTDGGEPSGLIAAGGSLYGTAGAGGYPSCHGQSGCGGAFQLSPTPDKKAWTESLPISFGPSSSGYPPSSALLGADAGDAYGVYSYGDDSVNVFSFRRNVFTSFGSEGTPQGVVADERGAFYVWTSTSTLYMLAPPNFVKDAIFHLPASGARVVLARGGEVYCLYTPSGKPASIVALVAPQYRRTGWIAGVISTFGGGAGGAGPNSLIFAKSGDLYGTTSAGGVANNGVIFRVPLFAHGRVAR